MKASLKKDHLETRRSFLRKTAAASAAIATVNALKTPVYGQEQAPAVGRIISPNDRLVVAYIGVGNQGMTHVRSQKSKVQENNIAQAAVCDLYQKRLGDAKTFLGLKDDDAVDDYRRVLERKDIDAVIVSTVDNWHAQVAVEALQAGKH